MFSTTRAAKLKFAGCLAASSLLLLTSCGRDQLSLPVAHAASHPSVPSAEAVLLPRPRIQPNSELLASSLADFERTKESLYRALPSKSCYGYMLHRPRAQRAEAVQARLEQADRMSARLDSEIFNIDLVGDHANVLSLGFPVKSFEDVEYTEKVSEVIVSYLSVPETQDSLCSTGFSEVILSAHGPNGGPARTVWTAKVTTDGLMKVISEGKHKQRLVEFAPAE